MHKEAQPNEIDRRNDSPYLPNCSSCRSRADGKTKKKDKKKDKRFQNTQLLLKNYRGLVAHCEKIKDELIEIDNKSIQDLDIEEISLESIESIKRSRSKTVAMVLFIQSKVKAYKDLCGENDQVKFRILEKNTYLKIK